MADLFASGSVVVWILGFLTAEAAVLLILRGRMKMEFLDVAAALGAGAALLLALRAALRGESWPIIACWLGVSLCAHLFDLKRRFAFNRHWEKR